MAEAAQTTTPRDVALTPEVRARVESVLESVTDAFFTLDRDFRFTYVNPSGEAQMRLSRNELLGRVAWDLFPAMRGNEFAKAYIRAAEERVPQRVNSYSAHFRGWYEAEVYPLDEGIGVFFRNVSGRRRAELYRELRTKVGRAIDDAVETADALAAVVRETRTSCGYEFGEAWTYDATSGVWDPVVLEHDEDGELAPFVAASRGRRLAPESILSISLGRGEPLVQEDLGSVAPFSRQRAAIAAGLKASIHIPLRIGDASPAVIGFFTRRGPAVDDGFSLITRLAEDLPEILGRHRARSELARVFHLSRDLICVSSSDGFFRRVNPAFSDVLGYTEEELLAHPFTYFVHPDDIERTVQEVERELATGAPTIRFDNRYRAKDGTYRWLSWTSRPVPEEGLLYGVARDVTDELKTQRYHDAQRELLGVMAAGGALSVTLERMARMVEDQVAGCMVSVLLVDPATATLHVGSAPSLPAAYNAAIEGLPVAEGIGSCGTAAFRAEPVIVTDIQIDPLWKDYRALAEEHGLRACWSFPFRNEKGSVLGTFAVYRREPGAPERGLWRLIDDAARIAAIAVERAAAERELRQSEERFRLASRATNDAVWDWNLATDELWWGEGFEVLFGYKRDAVEPDITSWSNRVHPEDRDRVVEALHRAIDEGANQWSGEYRFMRADGSDAYVLDRGYVIRDDQGRPIRMVGSMSDLTERRRMEQVYLRSQRMESIGTLAGGIAHDLNNVLTPIMMSVDLLKASGIAEEERDLLEAIGNAAARGSEMVRQVLTFARGVEGRRMPLAPADLVGDLERIIRDSFPKSITVRATVARDLSMIVGDPTQLHQVLLNLAVNARDAMPEGGTLTIAAGNVEMDEAFAAAIPDAHAGRYVMLEVSDTGVGIPPEIRDRIFDPFFTTKEPGKGTGLGLSTTAAIVRSHGGAMTLQSAVGRGSTFRVYLPAGAAAAASRDAEAPPVAPRGRGEFVLVVDDEPAVRTVAQRTLETFGYRVLTAADGAEAVALFARRHADIALVVTDMMMPVLDGVGTIHALRRIRPDVRVVAASGLAVNGQVARAAEAGVRHFLPKPYTTTELLTVVRAALDE